MEKSPWLRRTAVLFAVLLTAVLQRWTPPDSAHWHHVLPRLYYLPILIAALTDGWRGGLWAALLSGVALFSHLPASPPVPAD